MGSKIEKTQGWIKRSLKRARRWVLIDAGLSSAEWENLKYEELISLPVVKKLHLATSGGRVRFPGSESEDVKFGLRVTKNNSHAGGRLQRGEEFYGFGATLEDAVRDAIQVVVELASLRGERNG